VSSAVVCKGCPWGCLELVLQLSTAAFYKCVGSSSVQVEIGT
jgi:hypothetical protein